MVVSFVGLYCCKQRVKRGGESFAPAGGKVIKRAETISFEIGDFPMNDSSAFCCLLQRSLLTCGHDMWALESHLLWRSMVPMTAMLWNWQPHYACLEKTTTATS